MARRELTRPPGGPAREVHALYIAQADKSAAGRQVAGFLGGVAGPLGQQGVAVEVYRVRPRDLRDRRVLEAFRRRGIHRLPAVLARGRPLVGLAEIRAHYAGFAAGPGPGRAPPAFAFAEERRAAGPPAAGRAPEPPAEGPDDGSPEADLEEFLRQEIMAGRGDDDRDAGFGPG